MAPRTTKRLLITGSGRSGTKYAAFLLRSSGLDIVHERKMGADGISSWLFAVDADTAPWGPAPKLYSFEYVLQLTRDPRLAIPSIATFKADSWAYITSNSSIPAGDPPLLRAAKYWLAWNEAVEKRADMRIRIEDMPSAIEPVCRRFDVRFDRRAANRIPSDMNTRRYGKRYHIYENRCLRLGLVFRNALLKKLLSRREVTYADDASWALLESQAPVLMEQIRIKARDYGY